PARARYADDSPLVRNLVDFLAEGGPFDLTFGLFYDFYLAAPVEEALRRRGGLLINWPLNLLDREGWFSRALELFDETWCAEEEALKALTSRHGAKIRYVPLASDPFIFRPAGSPEMPRLLFVGSGYGERQELLAHCAKEIETTVAGAGFGVRGAVRAVGRALIREKRLPQATVRMMAGNLMA